MKVAFFGTSEFGIETLQALYENFSVEFVVTAPPKPAKRGQKMQNTPIFDAATILQIRNIYTPEKLTKEFEEYLQEIDYAVVVAYGKILPERILKTVKKRFLNLHPSDLPLFRGAAPIERTIEAGHRKTAICVIEMKKELDAGDIVAKEEYIINSQENSLNLHEKFAKIGAKLITDAIKNSNTIVEKQNHAMATYAKKIEKQELELNLVEKSKSVADIFNKIRAFASYGYCYVMYNGKRIKIILAEISQTKNTDIDIVCKDGFVTPKIIRPEGKNDMNVEGSAFVCVKRHK